MLKFYSASVRIANTERAVDECFDIAFANSMPLPEEYKVIIVNAPLGHQLDKVAAAIKKKMPDATVLGSSCSGVSGREGVGESMSDLAIMAICGSRQECAVAEVDGMSGSNSYAKGLELAKILKAKSPDATAIYLLCPGINVTNDFVLKAFDDIFGKEVVICGGTSSDNMRGLVNYQYIQDKKTETGAWAIAFSDKTLQFATRATHGFTAYGTPMTVTKAEDNKIMEIDGRPAWKEYIARLGLTPGMDSVCSDTILIGALAEELPEALAKEYGNSHILRTITKYDDDGTVYYSVSAKKGLKFWLTNRNENLIFSELRRNLDFIKEQLGTCKPVAVFQTDCLARGRLLFNKVMKDEIFAMMHDALSFEGIAPPWIGMYGFGEYARLGTKNMYHNYSTALLIFYR